MEGENAKTTKTVVTLDSLKLAHNYVRADNLSQKWETAYGFGPIKPMMALEYERKEIIESCEYALKRRSEAEKEVADMQAKTREANEKRKAELESELEECKENLRAQKKDWVGWSRHLAAINKEIDETPNDPETEESD
ncbi:hypothetical protein H634G_06527 [Metarhizium anisopliae BRIP 53293]|uniref:Uncharacterized protein n=1 Tax=Metarhizium anisopliae BRIP 53293 TaxID=1291518 RepID=A0A0D9NWG0_METAN|nr:hypothetical protein H634G_06527 [Metarhizium anisopliae BRIP 53293]KJK87495.1 hypothetical protein H633G_08645 [Metarhizium anisopliae BRIP 53284]